MIEKNVWKTNGFLAIVSARDNCLRIANDYLTLT
jgi:hypothetical protein